MTAAFIPSNRSRQDHGAFGTASDWEESLTEILNKTRRNLKWISNSHPPPPPPPYNPPFSVKSLNNTTTTTTTTTNGNISTKQQHQQYQQHQKHQQQQQDQEQEQEQYQYQYQPQPQPQYLMNYNKKNINIDVPKGSHHPNSSQAYIRETSLGSSSGGLSFTSRASSEMDSSSLNQSNHSTEKSHTTVFSNGTSSSNSSNFPIASDYLPNNLKSIILTLINKELEERDHIVGTSIEDLKKKMKLHRAGAADTSASIPSQRSNQVRNT